MRVIKLSRDYSEPTIDIHITGYKIQALTILLLIYKTNLPNFSLYLHRPFKTQVYYASIYN